MPSTGSRCSRLPNISHFGFRSIEIRPPSLHFKLISLNSLNNLNAREAHSEPVVSHWQIWGNFSGWVNDNRRGEFCEHRLVVSSEGKRSVAV